MVLCPVDTRSLTLRTYTLFMPALKEVRSFICESGTGLHSKLNNGTSVIASFQMWFPFISTEVGDAVGPMCGQGLYSVILFVYVSIKRVGVMVTRCLYCF